MQQAPLARRPFRAATTALAVLAVLATVPLSSGAATADATGQKHAPQLSIAITNPEKSVSVGDALRYTITVKNLGDTAVRGLRVTQTMPTGLDFTSADAQGVAAKGEVLWKVSLKASGMARVHSAMTVSKTPDQVLRLASVACGATAVGKAPIVCATDSAQLPAGAAAAAAADEADAPADTASSGLLSWRGALIGGAVVVAGAGLVLARRRRASATAATPVPAPITMDGPNITR